MKQNLASKQLENYAAEHKEPPTYTLSNGCPMNTITASLTVGGLGPLCLCVIVD